MHILELQEDRSNKKYYQKIAQHYASAQDYEVAVSLAPFLRTAIITAEMLLSCQIFENNGAFRVSLQKVMRPGEC